MLAIHVSWNSITTRSLLLRETDMTKFHPLIKNTNETKGYAIFQGGNFNSYDEWINHLPSICLIITQHIQRQKGIKGSHCQTCN